MSTSTGVWAVSEAPLGGEVAALVHLAGERERPVGDLVQQRPVAVGVDLGQPGGGVGGEGGDGSQMASVVRKAPAPPPTHPPKKLRHGGS